MMIPCILNVCACCVDFYPASWLEPRDHHVCNFTAALPHPPMYPRGLWHFGSWQLFHRTCGRDISDREWGEWGANFFQWLGYGKLGKRCLPEIFAELHHLLSWIFFTCILETPEQTYRSLRWKVFVPSFHDSTQFWFSKWLCCWLVLLLILICSDEFCWWDVGEIRLSWSCWGLRGWWRSVARDASRRASLAFSTSRSSDDF